MSPSSGSDGPLCPLEYANRPDARPPVALYRLAQACWAIPLTLGLFTLALFAATYSRSLPMIGFLTIFGGGFLLLIGAICLAVFSHALKRCDPDVRKRWSRRTAILMALLVLNIPAAIACAATGVWLMSRYTLVIVNNTDTVLRNIVADAAGTPLSFPDLPPGQTARKTFSVRGEGDISVCADQNGTPVLTYAGIYLSGMDAGKTTVTFNRTGPPVSSSR